jgi:HJR/Mrr/RecB family endonuclease
VTVTPPSGDKSADVIIEKNGKRIAIRAKLYKTKVDQSAVVEVLGSLNVYECCRGIVITNSYFQKSAIEIARVNNIELWDRDRLGKELVGQSYRN